MRKLLMWVPFKVTQNLHYDRLTKKIIHQILSANANAIDVGCHKGEVMDIILKAAPLGKHLGIEPIPELAKKLKEKYENIAVEIHAVALSDVPGISDFNLVISNPAYSGLKRRKYDRKEHDKSIEIDVRKLDDLVPKDFQVDLIKIDVEGGELGVLKGAIGLLKKWHPVLIFEHGKGGADQYGYGPTEMFKFLANLNYRIHTLDGFVKQKSPESQESFIEVFEKAKEYYFVAEQKNGPKN